MISVKQVLTVCLAGLMVVSPANACSFFVVHDGTHVFAGNNEDNDKSNTWVWYVPAEESSYGCVYFGYGDRFPQGGMNDQGLFYDGAATRKLPVKKGAGKKKLSLPKLFTTVMEKCASVEEVIELLEQYDLSRFERAQMLYADASGASVLVEGDKMIRGSGSYQISTNFYQSQVRNGKIPCRRYSTIDKILKAKGSASVDLVRSALAASHQEGVTPTQYSNIYDLVNLRIHLYHFHNFEEAVVIDLREELAKGEHESRIRDLFNESFASHNYRVRWENAKSRPDKSWFLANLNSFIALVVGAIAGGTVLGIFRRKRAGQDSPN
jgi:hypothetical protein